jgi:Transposase DDE domain
MILQKSLLVSLIMLVDHIPTPPPQKRGRGKPRFYNDNLFLKALIIMTVRNLHKVHELLSVLQQPTMEMQELKSLLTQDERFPSRRTWERRLKGIPDTLPSQIACLGKYLVNLIKPWEHLGRAVAIDSTLLRAIGGVWHKKHREKGIIPHTSIDIQAHWKKSEHHGWVYGWKLHIACTVASVWIPLAAYLTPANEDDGKVAPRLIMRLPEETRFILGDTHYNTPDVRRLCVYPWCILMASSRGKHPCTDMGVGVRKIFHKLRSLAIENFNEQFKGIFDVHGQVPTKGLVNTRRFALGAIFVYQIALLYRFQNNMSLRVGLKAFLKSA